MKITRAFGFTLDTRTGAVERWVPELDGRRARPWVVARKNSSRSLTGYTEMLMNAAGDARRFGSRESAQKLCDGLNGAMSKTARQAEHACCGSLVTGPHKMGCDYKLNAAPTDHVEDLLQMVPEIGSPEAFAASDDPDCRQGGKACEGCLMVGWCLGDFPPDHSGDADKMAAAVTKDSSAARPGAAARAKLEATPEGRALLAAAKAHLLQCLQLTPDGVEAFTVPTAAAMEVRPCRCGPDGCSAPIGSGHIMTPREHWCGEFKRVEGGAA